MSEEFYELEGELHAVYQSHCPQESQVDRVMSEISQLPIRRTRRRRWMWRGAAAVAVAAAAVLIFWLVSPPAERDENRSDTELTEKPVPPKDEKRDHVAQVLQKEPAERTRQIVIVQLHGKKKSATQPGSENHKSKSPSSGASSGDSAAVPGQSLASVIAIGKVGVPKMSSNGPLIDFAIDRVLVGELPGDKLVVRNEIPELEAFCQVKPPAPPTKVSEVFRPGTPVVLYFRPGGKTLTLCDIQPYSPRFAKIYDATQSKHAVKELKLLLRVSNGGIDKDALFLIRRFLPKQETAYLLLELVQETPDLLAKSPTGDQRDKIIRLRLEPVVRMLDMKAKQRSNSQMFKSLLKCLPHIQGERRKSTRADVYNALINLVRYGNLTPAQISQVRWLFLGKARGALAIEQMEKRSIGHFVPVDVKTAIGGLYDVADSKVVDTLLRELRRRPITNSHENVLNALSGSLERGCLAGKDIQRIKKTWLDMLLHTKLTKQDETDLIVRVAWAVVHANEKKYISLSARERMQIHNFYQTLPDGLTRNALSFLFKKESDK